MSPMKKMLVVFGILFALVFGWYGAKKAFIHYYIAHYEMPPVTVTASTAVPESWQRYVNAVGTLQAINGVDLSAESSGTVKQILFDSGQTVKAGDLLLTLNTQVEEAQLKNTQAQLKLAKMNYERDKTLFTKKATSQAALDASLAKLQQAQSASEEIDARIKQKNITAPFSGKVGIRQVDVGQFISPGTVIVTLQSLDPLYVRFNLPEQYLSELYVDQPIDVNVNLNGPDKQLIHGTIHAINAKVDQTTRNILVEASIPNPDKQLYPGMFADVTIWLKALDKVITLPQTAISYSLHGDSVFIISETKKDKKGKPILSVKREYVTVGDHRDNRVQILKGINPGETVVTVGQLKLQNNTHIIIDNTQEL